MKFPSSVFVSAIFAIAYVRSQTISAVFTLVSGTTGLDIAPIYPSNYGVYKQGISPGGRDSHKTIFYNNLLYTFHGGTGPSNDVWAFNCTSKTWSWLAGRSVDQGPFFGTKGVAAPTNSPGFRYHFCGDIHRVRNEYILFGGTSEAGDWEDMWTFNLNANVWTWFAGTSTNWVLPVYGSSTTSKPGSRYAPACTIYKPSGEFLLFGGLNSAVMADMWAFDFTLSKWTWISGTSSTSLGAVVGPKGQWSVSYRPGRRESGSIVLNTYNNVLYLFGGSGSSSNGNELNDMWAFKRDSLEWAWLSGDIAVKSPGVYGVKGQPSPSNVPGGRSGHSMIYHESSKLLIVYGGNQYVDTQTTSFYSDTWAFDTLANMWTWVAGASSKNSGPVLTGLTPTPAAQWFFGLSLDRDTGFVYMFGGNNYRGTGSTGTFNHVWRIEINPSSAVSTIAAVTTVSSVQLRGISSVWSHPSSAISPSQSSAGALISSQRSSTSSIERSTFSSQLLFDKSTATLSNIESSRLEEQTSLFLINKPPKLSTKAHWLSESSVPDVETASPLVNSLIAAVGPFFYYTILAIVIIFILVVNIGIYRCMLRRKISMITRSLSKAPTTIDSDNNTTSGQPDITSSSARVSNTNFTTSSSLSYSSTLAPTSVGLYLPGGLQVDAKMAYRVEKEIARGGGGSVWRALAFDPNLLIYGTSVIVKIPNSAVMNERLIALFHQELAIMNALKNQNAVVKLLGYTENPYSIILKYYRLGSLTRWIESGNRTVRQSFNFISDISDGIAVLHNFGIVHCDLKPDNILVEKGSRLFAVIADFGIARIVTQKLLKVGAYDVQRINGASLAFAAPEALKELRGGVSTMLSSPNVVMARDIYALGVIIKSVIDSRDVW